MQSGYHIRRECQGSRSRNAIRDVAIEENGRQIATPSCDGWPLPLRRTRGRHIPVWLQNTNCFVFFAILKSPANPEINAIGGCTGGLCIFM
jgi:hypothetical protein